MPQTMNKKVYIILGIVAVASVVYYFMNSPFFNIQSSVDNATNQNEAGFAPNEYLVGFISGTTMADITNWAKIRKVNLVSQLIGESGGNGPIWQIYSPNDKRPPEGGIVQYIERNSSVQATS